MGAVADVDFGILHKYTEGVGGLGLNRVILGYALSEAVAHRTL